MPQCHTGHWPFGVAAQKVKYKSNDVWSAVPNAPKYVYLEMMRGAAALKGLIIYAKTDKEI